MIQRNRLSILAFGALLAVSAGVAFAVAPQRTFVSSGGNDSNPCSLPSPCRGFQAGINAVAPGGEVVVLDSAGYGPVTITKSVSLIAPNGIYAGITVVAGDGITVDAFGATVVLRGLSINGQGGDNGINLMQAARLRVESCVVSSMGIDGIMHSAPGAELIVLDTIVRDNGASGIGGDADAFVVLDHVRSEHNGTNGFYLASFSAEAGATITDSVFVFNASNGIWIASTGVGIFHAQVERSVLADNGAAGIKITAVNSNNLVGITRNVIQRNHTGVAVFGPGDVAATVSENAIGSNITGISADGSNTSVDASANSFTYHPAGAFSQLNSSHFSSYGNNAGHNFLSGGTIVVVGGH
jgi:hypothetical protein